MNEMILVMDSSVHSSLHATDAAFYRYIMLKNIVKLCVFYEVKALLDDC